MDARRLLMLAAAGPALWGCALAGAESAPLPATPGGDLQPATAGSAIPQPAVVTHIVAMAPIPDPPLLRPLSRPDASHDPRALRAAPVHGGRAAIAIANVRARTRSREDAFVGGVQVFAYQPGRVYEVWTAPFRVTTITLAPAETIVSKAAGDTVRWQIGETASGAGTARRAHVLVKPLQRGLETNLVLATNQRVYMLELMSGAPEAFNAAVMWDAPPAPPALAKRDADRPAADPVVGPQGRLDARYRISARGRAPRWTPASVINDGVRTFITFPQDLGSNEAPALFVLAPDGEAQMVNYRQQGGVFVVDQVFDRAELRLGQKRPQVVRIERLGGRP